jgi:hypothetical protein
MMRGPSSPLSERVAGASSGSGDPPPARRHGDARSAPPAPGTDLLDAGSIERGGILPSMILSTIHLGPLGVSLLTAILLAHDVTQLNRLRGRILRLGAVVR